MDDAHNVQPWRIYGERTIYDNPWVRLTLVDVEPPGTERFEHHVVHLQRVAIAAVIDDQDRVWVSISTSSLARLIVLLSCSVKRDTRLTGLEAVLLGQLLNLLKV